MEKPFYLPHMKTLERLKNVVCFVSSLPKNFEQRLRSPVGAVVFLHMPEEEEETGRMEEFGLRAQVELEKEAVCHRLGETGRC